MNVPLSIALMNYLSTYIEPLQSDWSFVNFTKDYCIQLAKPQLDANRPKSPPPAAKQGKIFRLNLSISCDFKQLWFSRQKSPPPPYEGNFFYTGSIHFRQFPATLVFVAEKPPRGQTGKFFLHWIYPFQAISSNFGFCGRKAPPMRTSTAQGLPPITKDYLQRMVTHLVNSVFTMMIPCVPHPISFNN